MHLYSLYFIKYIRIQGYIFLNNDHKTGFYSDIQYAVLTSLK